MACREGFDLFNKYQRGNFFRRGIFGDKWARHYVLKDTFGHHVCSIIGHSKKIHHITDTCGEPPFDLCDRCGNHVSLHSTHKEAEI
jgi:hypothetical protein